MMQRVECMRIEGRTQEAASSLMVIDDSGAVHCKSSKQQIVTKSSTEVELVALSDSAIKYFWLKERVDTGEARVKHLRMKHIYANVLTKPLQGAKFKEERKGVNGWPDKDLA